MRMVAAVRPAPVLVGILLMLSWHTYAAHSEPEGGTEDSGGVVTGRVVYDHGKGRNRWACSRGGIGLFRPENWKVASRDLRQHSPVAGFPILGRDLNGFLGAGLPTGKFVIAAELRCLPRTGGHEVILRGTYGSWNNPKVISVNAGVGVHDIVIHVSRHPERIQNAAEKVIVPMEFDEIARKANSEEKASHTNLGVALAKESEMEAYSNLVEKQLEAESSVPAPSSLQQPRRQLRHSVASDLTENTPTTGTTGEATVTPEPSGFANSTGSVPEVSPVETPANTGIGGEGNNATVPHSPALPRPGEVETPVDGAARAEEQAKGLVEEMAKNATESARHNETEGASTPTASEVDAAAAAANRTARQEHRELNGQAGLAVSNGTDGIDELAGAVATANVSRDALGAWATPEEPVTGGSSAEQQMVQLFTALLESHVEYAKSRLLFEAYAVNGINEDIGMVKQFETVLNGFVMDASDDESVTPIAEL